MSKHEIESSHSIVAIPAGTSKTFWFPLQENNQYVRTGVISDGSCLFHSLLYAYSIDYITMPTNKKIEVAVKLRSSISKKIDKDFWKNINGGVIAMVGFQEIFNGLVRDFYTSYNTVPSKRKSNMFTRTSNSIYDNLVKDKTSKDIYESLLELIKIETIQKTSESINTQDLDEYKDKMLTSLCELLKKKLKGSKMEMERIRFFVSKFSDLIVLLLEKSEEMAFEIYTRSLEDPKTFIDQFYIDLISDEFNFDIYFIDANTRLPYNTGSGKSSYKNRKSVIILWIDDNHYEIIGRVIPGTKKVQRVFDHSDSIIKMLNTLQCNPERFAKKYPNFSHLVPKSVMDKIKKSVKEHDNQSDDEEERIRESIKQKYAKEDERRGRTKIISSPNMRSLRNKHKEVERKEESEEESENDSDNNSNTVRSNDIYDDDD